MFPRKARLLTESYPQMPLTRHAPKFVNPAGILLVFSLSPERRHREPGAALRAVLPVLFVPLKIADLASAVCSSRVFPVKWGEP